MLCWHAAQRADLLQRLEKWVIIRQSFTRVGLSACGLLGGSAANDATQRLLQERTEKLAFLPSLFLKLAQEHFVNFQRRPHDGRLGLRWRTVNGARRARRRPRRFAQSGALAAQSSDGTSWSRCRESWVGVTGSVERPEPTEQRADRLLAEEP
jgi:hypothetical protein